MNHMNLPTSPTPGSFLKKLDAFLLATHRASLPAPVGPLPADAELIASAR